MRKIIATSVAIVMAAVGVTFAPSATAEAARPGAFRSYIENWDNGFRSRVWYDNNDDSIDGHIQFQGCTSNPLVGVLNVDTNTVVVQEIMWCLNAVDDFLHGRLPRGNYQFVVIDKRGTSLLDVHRVYVRYQSGDIVD